MPATSLTIKGLDPILHHRMRIAANYFGQSIADFVTAAISEKLEAAPMPQAAFPSVLQWKPDKPLADLNCILTASEIHQALNAESQQPAAGVNQQES